MSRITLIIVGGEKIKGLCEQENNYWVSWSQWLRAATIITPRSAKIQLDDWLELNQSTVVWPLSYRSLPHVFSEMGWMEYQQSAWQAMMLILMQHYPFINGLAHEHLSDTFWHPQRARNGFSEYGLEWNPKRTSNVWVHCFGNIVWGCESDGLTQVVVPLQVVRACQKLMGYYQLDVGCWGFSMEKKQWIAVVFLPELMPKIRCFPEALKSALNKITEQKTARKHVFIADDCRPKLMPS